MQDGDDVGSDEAASCLTPLDSAVAGLQKGGMDMEKDFD